MTEAGVDVYLVDGTYELFRHHYGRAAGRRTSEQDRSVDVAPPLAAREDGPGPGAPEPVHFAATRGALGSILSLLEHGATHIAVATDHVIESFRNRMWEGYKTASGMPADLLAQFQIFEDALASMGVVVWAMVDFEADDALGSAAKHLGTDQEIARILICTPDKDLAQCVVGQRVVQLDRRSRPQGPVVIDEQAVIGHFGVAPGSIPDWLALVGDTSDGYPGLAGWGPRSASAVLSHYGHIEHIPDVAGQWEVTVRSGAALARTLAEHRAEAALFKRLATLRDDALTDVRRNDLRWSGPTAGFGELCGAIGAPGLARRAERLSSG